MNGIHLIIDGFKPEKKVLMNKDLIFSFLDELPRKINMKKLCSPQIFEGSRTNPGITGFILIEKSHISVHTFLKEDFIAIDIYSCKPFDVHEVIEIVKKTFNFERMKTKVVVRG